MRRAAALPVALLAAAVVVGPFAASVQATEVREVVGGELLGQPGVVVAAPTGDPLPQVKATSWVLADLETGQILAAKNAHLRLRPASTLKILTALAVMPELDPAATYVAQWDDANVEGSKVGVVPEATYTVHNLLEALFLVSGNDAASALANAAGGVEQTVTRMNAVARGLGALDTKATNPSGLDAAGQRSSAYDLAVLARAAMERDDFRAYAATVKSQFPGTMPKRGKVRKTYEIYTQDKLLLNYRGGIGIKTGWTTKARGTFVGAATRGGRTLIATVMNTDAQSWRESAALLTWGFKNGAAAEPVGTLDAIGETEAVPASLGEDTAPAGSAASSADGAGSGGLPWWMQVALALVGVVTVLRLRVLFVQRRRAVRRAQYGRTLAARARRL